MCLLLSKTFFTIWSWIYFLVDFFNLHCRNDIMFLLTMSFSLCMSLMRKQAHSLDSNIRTQKFVQFDFLCSIPSCFSLSSQRKQYIKKTLCVLTQHFYSHSFLNNVESFSVLFQLILFHCINWNFAHISVCSGTFILYNMTIIHLFLGGFVEFSIKSNSSCCHF